MTTIWLRPDEAAVWLGTTVGNIHVLAHRNQWRRQGHAGTLRYNLDDIEQTATNRHGHAPKHSA